MSPESDPEKWLSKSLTGTPHATRREMIKAINQAHGLKPDHHPFLIQMETIVKKWENRFAFSKTLDLQDSLIIARRILNDILRVERVEADSLHNFEKNCTQEEKNALDDTLLRLELMENEIYTLLRKHEK